MKQFQNLSLQGPQTTAVHKDGKIQLLLEFKHEGYLSSTYRLIIPPPTFFFAFLKKSLHLHSV